MDRYFYITIVSSCKVDVQHLKGQKVGEVADMAVEVVCINHKQLSYPSCTQATRIDSIIYDVHLKPAPHCLDQMAKNEAVEEKDKEKPKKELREGVQLPRKFKNDRPAFSKMVGEFESM